MANYPHQHPFTSLRLTLSMVALHGFTFAVVSIIYARSLRSQLLNGVAVALVYGSVSFDPFQSYILCGRN
jgi:hypothetical protein